MGARRRHPWRRKRIPVNADIITNLAYPHGTADGFRDGCNTNHCPSEVSCRTVHTRYNGDWAFRRQIHAGMTPLEIVTIEYAHAQEAAEAERARRSTETREAAKERHNATRRHNRAANLIPQEALIPRHTLRELLNQGLTDREIGVKLGLTRRQVTGARNSAGWERNPDRKGVQTATKAPANVGAES